MKTVIERIDEDRSAVCERILHALPKWFGIESAIQKYIQDVAHLPTWVARRDGQEAGFLSLSFHNPYTAEIHVMGVLESFHRQGVGHALVREAEAYLGQRYWEYLQVKTLSPRHPDPNYAQTREFYLDMGFRPVEEFRTLWSEANPCLLLIKAIPSRDPHLIIRRARAEDAEAIHRAHMRSIQQVCRNEYTPEQIGAWGGRPYVAEHRLKAIREDSVWVVEFLGEIAGFGQMMRTESPGVGEVMALYLTPEALGKGAGKRILFLMEERARELGWAELKLGASLTAREFYRRQGYELDGDPRELAIGGVGIPYIPMKKLLEKR
jgi:GNAT superfamily N-acetyltransferase